MHYLKKRKKKVIHYHSRFKKRKAVFGMNCDYGFFIIQMKTSVVFSLKTLVLVQKSFFKKVKKNVQLLFKCKVNKIKTKKITTEFCKDDFNIFFIILFLAHLEGVEPSTC